MLQLLFSFLVMSSQASFVSEEFEETLRFQGFPSVNRFEFENPQFNSKALAAALSEFDHLDPNHLVPDLILEQALNYFVANRSRIRNQNYISIIDFKQHSGSKRFYVINMQTGAVEVLHTAHGSGSDSNSDGYATSFSNTANSHKSSIGFAVTAETYNGKNGYSLRLDGLQATNSKLRERAIVVHKADYVSSSRSKMGMSWGCPALSKSVGDRIVNQIKNGSLIYQYAGQ